jgi:HD superfamily phosphohydrolase
LIHRDEVHGDVRYDPLSVALLDTPQLQRLGRVYQLGFGHLVYRGGNHTRLGHSMGAFSTAALLADSLQQNYESGDRPPEGALEPEEFLPLAPRAATAEEGAQMLWVERSGQGALRDRWIVLRHLVCWAALVHDVGHVPLGHTLEDEFDNIYEGHDAVTSERLRYIWLDADSEIRHVLEDTSLYPEAFAAVGITNGALVHQAVLLICTWKEEIEDGGNRVTFREILERILARRPPEQQGIAEELIDAIDAVQGTLFHPFMADLVANTISADYLDYLRRDPHNLGLDVLKDARVASHFWAGRDNREQARMALALEDRHGKQRLDTCTGVVELVRQRFRFAEIVYYHKTKVAASAMMAKVFHLLENPPELPRESRRTIELGEAAEIASKLMAAEGKARRELVEVLVEGCTPGALLDPEIGDESLGLLLRNQAFAQLREASREGDEPAVADAVRALALLDALARRRLYKTAFKMSAKSFFKIKGWEHEQSGALVSFIQRLRGDAAVREQAERKMVGAAGLPEGAIILYVPDRKSQAKGIDTGALFDGGVTTLGSHRAVKADVEILNRKYEDLWHLIVLVHPAHQAEDLALSRAVDAFLGDQFEGVSPFRGGVIEALEQDARFRYQPLTRRPSAEQYEQLTKRTVESAQWDSFERICDGNGGCTARQQGMAAALVDELTIRGRDREKAVEFVIEMGIEEVERQVLERATAVAGSFDGSLDSETDLQVVQGVLAELASELQRQ